MAPGGADGQRGNGKRKTNALPSDYVPPVTAGHMAPTLGEPDPSQSSGDTWIRLMGGRIRSGRNGPGLSRGKYVLLTHFSNLSGGDPLLITPWLSNQNRDLETSLRLVNPRAGPQ